VHSQPEAWERAEEAATETLKAMSLLRRPEGGAQLLEGAEFSAADSLEAIHDALGQRISELL